MPALNESSTPETMLAVALSGLYVVRTPSPAAIPMGVVMPKRIAPRTGTYAYLGGSSMYASREPTPRPSNVSEEAPFVRNDHKRRGMDIRTVEDDDDEENDELLVHGEGEADEHAVTESCQHDVQARGEHMDAYLCSSTPNSRIATPMICAIAESDMRACSCTCTPRFSRSDGPSSLS